MRVTGAGLAQTATRAGSQIIVPPGARPGSPTILTAWQLAPYQLLERKPGQAAPATPGAPSGILAVEEALASRQRAEGRAPGTPQATAATTMPITTQAIRNSQTQAAMLRLTPQPATIQQPVVQQPVVPIAPVQSSLNNAAAAGSPGNAVTANGVTRPAAGTTASAGIASSGGTLVLMNSGTDGFRGSLVAITGTVH